MDVTSYTVPLNACWYFNRAFRSPVRIFLQIDNGARISVAAYHKIRGDITFILKVG